MTDLISTTQWPPASLKQLDLKYCQAKEVSARVPDLDVYVVHMAALLYHQDWMAARHLFRRSGELNELRPWYEVAMAALKPDLEAVWKSLVVLHGNTALSPVQTYVNEIAHAFRVACLSKFNNETNIPEYLAPVLGFTTVEDMANFAREYRVPVSPDNSLVVAAGFLQSRLTADLSTMKAAAKKDDSSAGLDAFEATAPLAQS